MSVYLMALWNSAKEILHLFWLVPAKT